MDHIEQLRLTLREHGQSLTSARQIVFAALQHQEPLTMQQLVTRCAGIDRASVYRCVGLFEQVHIIHRLQIGWKYKLELSDAFRRHHHHLTCSMCGSVTVLAEDAMIEQRLKTLATRYGFTPETHQVELTGICADCN